MKYIVGLKSELDLLNENDAKRRYLEMLAAGYKENDVFVAAPVPVSSDVTFGNEQPNQNWTTTVDHKTTNQATKDMEIPLNPS
ncbi:MAG: hypothetical protein ACYCVD_06655 [Desulfitobacteriaceae bacterium]